LCSKIYLYFCNMQIFRTSLSVIAAVAILTLAQSCTFNKLQKSTDTDLKLKSALDYFAKEKYSKAVILLEDIALLTRGTKDGEEVMYKLAYSNYYIKDYILAGYYFRKYTEYYPKGTYSEDSYYMSAYCYYKDSPKTTLEQSATYTALTAFEVFFARYPKSAKIAECNILIDELRNRLEKKSYDNAKLYYDMGYYNAAVISLKNSLQSFPDTDYKEQALFYIVKSGYLYAENSVGSKQKERYDGVIKDYNKFTAKFPESKYIDEAAKIKKNAEKKSEKLTADLTK